MFVVGHSGGIVKWDPGWDGGEESVGYFETALGNLCVIAVKLPVVTTKALPQYYRYVVTFSCE